MSLHPSGSGRGAGRAAAGDPYLYRELGHAHGAALAGWSWRAGGRSDRHGGRVGAPGAAGRAWGQFETGRRERLDRAGEGACGALPTVWGTAWDTTFWRLRKSMEEQSLREMVVHPLPDDKQESGRCSERARPATAAARHRPRLDRRPLACLLDLVTGIGDGVAVRGWASSRS